MGVAFTAMAFEDTLENGGEAMKLGFFRAQQYKVADRAVAGRKRDDLYLVDCAVTGTTLGTPDDPKFPLKPLFERHIFPKVEGLVAPGGAYEGYTPVFQGDNAGPHEQAGFISYVTGHCASKGWHWEPQAPQMPHMNVLDLSVFPCMSRRHCALARRTGGCKVLSEDHIWSAAEKVWRGLESAKIAAAYVQAHRIAAKVIKNDGSNRFLGAGGSIHVGIRKDFEETAKGLVRKEA
jgi:hypothetical protein